MLVDNFAVLMFLVAQADTRLPVNRRCQRTPTDAAKRAVLPSVLLVVGDVSDPITQTLDLAWPLTRRRAGSGPIQAACAVG